MSKTNNLMPSSLDRQISTEDQDAFGHRHFAAALRSLVESMKHAPPFSIGLLGGWGTGKSSIKELYIRDLQNDARKNEAGQTRSDQIRSITFNAWRFGGKEQDIKRALLRHVFLELGGDEENLQDRLFRQINETHEEQKGYWEHTLEILKAWAMPIPALVLSLCFLIGLLFLVILLIPVQGDLALSIIVIAFTGAYTYLLKQIKAPPVTGQRPITRIALPSTTAEQYEDLLLEQITKFKSGKSKATVEMKGKACERLVVFVDDLDRLSAEEMVLGLDAVRTFMEIPEARLPKGLGLVFVISCDETKVAHALSERRRQGDMPGTVFSQSDARRYLDRIFQFRLEIPPFPRQDMRQYAIKLLNELPGIEADLRDRSVPVETVIDRMIHVGVQDPRNALQIVNAFAQAWWLAKKRETEELGTGRTGGLHEGAVTAHPVSLGALSAIKVNFPDFYRDLQNEPTLLHRLTDVLVRKKLLEEQPLAAQQILTERYLKKRSGNTEDPLEVCPEHRSLRQFLSSLIGLRWPDSLQSLLLLSEDPITRSFGARAAAIYAAFVSGDTQGVLEGLGRHIEASPLNQEEANLLYQMTEELRHDTASRRINASRVIADLVDRLPKEKVHLLLGPVCRELGDTAELRSQLGIKKISKILTAAHADDRRAVASRLVEDILTTKEDVRFRLETMEPPNLEEAVAFARAAVKIVLPIRRDHGLDPASDIQLLAWLVDRTVGIGGKDQQLPFEELEQWMADHEDHILPDLADRYTDILATELEGKSAPSFDLPTAIGRACKVFSILWYAGEDTRQTLWKSLTRYISIKLPEAPHAAWEVMVEHVTSPSSFQISEFVAAFGERLGEEAKEEEWELDFLTTAAQALLTLVRTRLQDIDKSTLDTLSSLAILWSRKDETGILSCDIAKELRRKDSTEAQQVFDSWAQRILDDLPIDCINLLASVFPTLEMSIQSNTITQLNPVIKTDTIDEPTGKRYEAFVKGVPDDAWETASLKGHLDSLLPQIAARHNNPNAYLYRIFPTIVEVLNHASPGPLGQALNTLFTQAKGQPKHYAWLHSWMAKRWPEPSANLKPYDPVQIFREGVDFATAQPLSSTGGLLGSLRDMITRELVPAAQSTALIEAACSTWTVAPEHAIDTFTSGYGDLTHDQTANLIDPIDWSNDEHQALLSRAWSSVVQSQEPSDRIETTKRILDRGACGNEDEPDRGLHLWLDAQGGSNRDVLQSAITQSELNDIHRKRLWQQAVLLMDVLDPGFFLDVIPKIAVLSPIEETAKSIFADYDLVFEALGTTDNRADLSQRLMKCFPEVATNTVKSEIVAWCKKLNGEASLRNLKPEMLTDDDVSILETHFGRASELKKLVKARISK